MKAFSHMLVQKTDGKRTYEITSAIEKVVADSEIQTGTATVFVQHTSCSVVIMENADPSARADMHAFFDALVPEDIPYFVHTYEGLDDMPSHIRMVLTGCSEVIPIVNGHLALGTWQGIFLFEHRNAPQTRKIAISVMGI